MLKGRSRCNSEHIVGQVMQGCSARARGAVKWEERGLCRGFTKKTQSTRGRTRFCACKRTRVPGQFQNESVSVCVWTLVVTWAAWGGGWLTQPAWCHPPHDCHISPKTSPKQEKPRDASFELIYNWHWRLRWCLHILPRQLPEPTSNVTSVYNARRPWASIIYLCLYNYAY